MEHTGVMHHTFGVVDFGEDDVHLVSEELQEEVIPLLCEGILTLCHKLVASGFSKCCALLL